MKTPKPDSIADKIGHLLLKQEPQKYADIVAAMAARGHMDKSTAKALRDMRTELQLDHDEHGYSLSHSMRRYYEMTAPDAPYKGEIVPKREAKTMQDMTSGLSPKYQFWNAPRREPIRLDVGFKTAGTGHIPFDYQS